MGANAAVDCDDAAAGVVEVNLLADGVADRDGVVVGRDSENVAANRDVLTRDCFRGGTYDHQLRAAAKIE